MDIELYDKHTKKSIWIDPYEVVALSYNMETKKLQLTLRDFRTKKLSTIKGTCDLDLQVMLSSVCSYKLPDDEHVEVEKSCKKKGCIYTVDGTNDTLESLNLIYKSTTNTFLYLSEHAETNILSIFSLGKSVCAFYKQEIMNLYRSAVRKSCGSVADVASQSAYLENLSSHGVTADGFVSFITKMNNDLSWAAPLPHVRDFIVFGVVTCSYDKTAVYRTIIEQFFDLLGECANLDYSGFAAIPSSFQTLYMILKYGMSYQKKRIVDTGFTIRDLMRECYKKPSVAVKFLAKNGYTFITK